MLARGRAALRVMNVLARPPQGLEWFLHVRNTPVLHRVFRDLPLPRDVLSFVREDRPPLLADRFRSAREEKRREEKRREEGGVRRPECRDGPVCDLLSIAQGDYIFRVLRSKAGTRRRLSTRLGLSGSSVMFDLVHKIRYTLLCLTSPPGQPRRRPYERSPAAVLASTRYTASCRVPAQSGVMYLEEPRYQLAADGAATYASHAYGIWPSRGALSRIQYSIRRSPSVARRERGVLLPPSPDAGDPGPLSPEVRGVTVTGGDVGGLEQSCISAWGVFNSSPH
ncbi:hypothetical protein V8D89_008862 [Ganoderma adspersum]